MEQLLKFCSRIWPRFCAKVQCVQIFVKIDPSVQMLPRLLMIISFVIPKWEDIARTSQNNTAQVIVAQPYVYYYSVQTRKPVALASWLMCRPEFSSPPLCDDHLASRPALSVYLIFLFFGSWYRVMVKSDEYYSEKETMKISSVVLNKRYKLSTKAEYFICMIKYCLIQLPFLLN